MKGLICAFIILFMPVTVNAYTGFGICNFGKETRSTIVCYGPSVLTDTVVTGDVKIAGTLKAYNVSIGSLTIKGSVDIQKSHIKGMTNVTGSLNATSVLFQNNVAIIGKTATLTHSTVNGSITIGATNSNAAILMLQCGTVVSGSVIFEGAPGVVQVTNDSIIKDKIVNGTFQFINKSCS